MKYVEGGMRILTQDVSAEEFLAAMPGYNDTITQGRITQPQLSFLTEARKDMPEMRRKRLLRLWRLTFWLDGQAEDSLHFQIVETQNWDGYQIVSRYVMHGTHTVSDLAAIIIGRQIAASNPPMLTIMGSAETQPSRRKP